MLANTKFLPQPHNISAQFVPCDEKKHYVGEMEVQWIARSLRYEGCGSLATWSVLKLLELHAGTGT